MFVCREILQIQRKKSETNRETRPGNSCGSLVCTIVNLGTPLKIQNVITGLHHEIPVVLDDESLGNICFGFNNWKPVHLSIVVVVYHENEIAVKKNEKNDNS